MEYKIKQFGKWWLLKDKATGRVVFKSANRRDLDDYIQEQESEGK
jgi:hypothetical protein